MPIPALAFPPVPNQETTPPSKLRSLLMGVFLRRSYHDRPVLVLLLVRAKEGTKKDAGIFPHLDKTVLLW